MRHLCAAVVFMLATASTFAQSAEQDIRKAMDALATAAKAGDRANYLKLLADDLVWINDDGSVVNKTQRLAALKPATLLLGHQDVTVKVFGDTAVVVAQTNFKDRKSRTHRVFTKRGGQWLLLTHSGTTIR